MAMLSHGSYFLLGTFPLYMRYARSRYHYMVLVSCLHLAGWNNRSSSGTWMFRMRDIIGDIHQFNKQKVATAIPVMLRADNACLTLSRLPLCQSRIDGGNS